MYKSSFLFYPHIYLRSFLNSSNDTTYIRHWLQNSAEPHFFLFFLHSSIWFVVVVCRYWPDDSSLVWLDDWTTKIVCSLLITSLVMPLDLDHLSFFVPIAVGSNSLEFPIILAAPSKVPTIRTRYYSHISITMISISDKSSLFCWSATYYTIRSSVCECMYVCTTISLTTTTTYAYNSLSLSLFFPAAVYS